MKSSAIIFYIIIFFLFSIGTWMLNKYYPLEHYPSTKDTVYIHQNLEIYLAPDTVKLFMGNNLIQEYIPVQKYPTLETSFW
jgi:hypothetical protein